MFENKNVVILGLARSGISASKFLRKRNCNVIVNDKKETEDENILKELKSIGVKVILGSHPDDLINTKVDYLIKNPGVPIDHKYVLKARELGIPVINEVEIAYLSIPKNKNIKILAITGSNGKTTTTTLAYNYLKEDGKKVVLAGNIGYPLCNFIDSLEEDTIIVMETSCQQLENLDKFKPDVAIMTNIVEAHIDFMKTYDHYKYVKSKLLKNQTGNDVAILNKESSELLKAVKDAKSNKKYFSSKEIIEGAYIKNNKIYYYNEEIIDIKDLKLRGVHNYENIMASVMAVKEFGCKTESIRKVLKTFMGVEHRLEFVDNINGRIFYNDTEATNIKCTQIALASFSEPTIVLLGGLERGQKFTDLKPFCDNVKAIVASGECKERVKDFGDKEGIPTYVCDYITDATEKAYEISEPGDVILLSPGSASWDQFKQCEDRGDLFKKTARSFK
ncbi:MAG: UDP-N-acetylmuramoyl-L-alanine--D-glutamate ligase [Bacilli bacterium]